MRLRGSQEVQNTRQFREAEIRALRQIAKLVLADLLDLFFNPEQKINLVKYLNTAEELRLDNEAALAFAKFSPDALARNFTAGRCEAATVRFLGLMQAQHTDLFDRFVLVNSYASKANGRFKQNENWNFHALALLRDRRGQWLAFSPANYQSATDLNQPLERIISGQDLSLVLAQFQEMEGGNWHPEDEVWIRALNQKPDEQIQFFAINPDRELSTDPVFTDPARRRNHRISVAIAEFQQKLRDRQHLTIGAVLKIIHRLGN